MKNFILMVAVLLLSCGGIFAQRKNLDIADEYYQQRKFIEAIEYYQLALNEKVIVNKYYMLSQIARTYSRLFDYENASKYYEQLLAYKEENASQNLYEYAQVLMNEEKYEKAKEVFGMYTIRENPKATMQHFEEKCNWALQNKSQKPSAEIAITNIETGSRSFGIALHSNGAIFSIPQTDKFSEQTTYYDLGFAEKTNVTTFTTPVNLGEIINNIYYEGAPTIASNGTAMYFTANGSSIKKYKEKKKDEFAISSEGVNILKVYSAKKINGVWDSVVELSINSNNYNVTFPHISADGNTLYFCSDMPGGLGGLDIYYVEKLGNNQWSAPINLGPEVNTYEDETYPFVMDNKFYFSSKGREGFGGFDIYSGSINDKMITNCNNIGAPINSSKDDFSYVLSDDSKTGYFSSNREGTHGYDKIYHFEMKNTRQWIEGVVKNGENGSPIAGVEVQLLRKVSDDEWVLENKQITVEDGKWKFEIDPNETYQVKFIHPDFASNDKIIPSINEDDAGYRDNVINELKETNLDPVAKTISGIVTDAQTGQPIKDVVVTLFEIDNNGNRVEVNKKVTQQDGKWSFDVDPTKKYEVTFKHPTLGEKTLPLAAYNGSNNEVRNNQVKDLKNVTLNDANSDNILAGIVMDKLSSTPIEGVKVTLFEKSKGKWVEVNNMTTKTDGKWSFQIDSKKEYKVTFDKNQYESKEFEIPTLSDGQKRKEIIASMNPFEMKPEGKKDNTFTINNIYFDFARSSPKEESYAVLDKIVAFLNENPSISIELSAHTDCVGKDDFNMDLSQRRAERCKDYLIKKGISSSRIKAKGYGETKILNGCVKWDQCTEEQNQVNRRVEIKVL
jgi:outer membrane protein OmpA-like peptidoglycan-associated protein